MTAIDKTPKAEILITTGCVHCPAVVDGLSQLIKQGLIGELRIINVTRHPEEATRRNARSAPWTRIGPFVLQGNYSREELRGWAERAASGEGMGEYFAELLQNQQLQLAVELARNDPSQLDTLVALIADLDTPMGVRIGVGALFEELAQHGQLSPALPGLIALTRATDSQVRADAAHYLGLLGADTAREYLLPLLKDDNAEVREIAAESLQS